MYPSSFDFARYIDELRKRQIDVLKRIKVAQEELDDIEKQLSLAQQTAENYCKLFNLPEPAANQDLNEKFANKTIREMLIEIARDSSGILDFSHAKNLLVKAGVFKDERNAATSISPILTRKTADSPFSKLRRGVYELKPEYKNEDNSSKKNSRIKSVSELASLLESIQNAWAMKSSTIEFHQENNSPEASESESVSDINTIEIDDDDDESLELEQEDLFAFDEAEKAVQKIPLKWEDLI